LSLLLDGILGGTMKDDEKPPTSNSGIYRAPYASLQLQQRN
jgi:hypothetical protein